MTTIATKTLQVIVSLAVTFNCLNCGAKEPLAEVSVQNLQAKSGNHYLLIGQGGTSAHWTTVRPKSSDTTKVLCIPAAFTDFHGAVDGIHAYGGRLVNGDKPDKSIGGTVLIVDGKCQILSSPAGKFSEAFLEQLTTSKGDLFQQFKVVADGAPEKFKDKSLFQRRGIGILKDGGTVVIESSEAITLTAFGADAASLGLEQLAYTDMGPWDEGWYRNPKNGQLVVIGQNRSLTGKQSNWFYFEITRK